MEFCSKTPFLPVPDTFQLLCYPHPTWTLFSWTINNQPFLLSFPPFPDSIEPELIMHAPTAEVYKATPAKLTPILE